MLSGCWQEILLPCWRHVDKRIKYLSYLGVRSGHEAVKERRSYFHLSQTRRCTLRHFWKRDIETQIHWSASSGRGMFANWSTCWCSRHRGASIGHLTYILRLSWRSLVLWKAFALGLLKPGIYLVARFWAVVVRSWAHIVFISHSRH